MAKKNKAAKINLDDLELKDEAVSAEDIIKIRDIKFSKLPSKTARMTAEHLFKSLDAKDSKITGRAFPVANLDAERKDSFVSTMKKELAKIAKEAKRTNLRVRVSDQGSKVVFFYEPKKQKGDGKKKAA